MARYALENPDDPLVSYRYFCSYPITILLVFKPLNPLIHNDKTVRADDRKPDDEPDEMLNASQLFLES
jgi:hypothetical protein